MFASKETYRACIYTRLSRDDGDKPESDSIANQRALIRDYLKQHKEITIVSDHSDDGYSGVNFERPGFAEMMDEIREGKVDCVVVKDLSRFGRNYIEAGNYVEKVFPFMGVRFIAINDSYDSSDKSQSDSLVIPFKNLINDAYCKDISVKIRSQLEIKRKKGEYIGAFVAYGYVKDPEDHNRIIVDTYAAEVVRAIFRWKMAGMSQNRIADKLNSQGVLCPKEWGTFVLDMIKGYFIAVAIVYAFIMLIMVIFETFGNLAFIVATAAMVIIMLLIALIIVPLMRIYNKFTPLEEGELRDKLTDLCTKYGMKIRKIVVKDASRRTTTSNAFCSGFGKMKTISLDDNLVNNYDSDEIVAVFAHEFGHARFRHVIKSLPFSIVSMLITFLGLYVVLNIPALYTPFGFEGINYFFAQMLLSLMIWPLSKFFSAVTNYISRKHEYQADAFAAGEGYGNHLISALKRLSKEALSDINPHPLKVLLDYSHPTLSQRIEAINKIDQIQVKKQR